MDKKKIQILITSLLSLMLIVAIGNAVFTILKIKKGGSRAVITPEPKIFDQSAEESKIHIVTREDIAGIENLRWLRDPFNFKRYITVQKHSTTQLLLKGIIWDENDPCAVIDDRVLRKGDKIDTIKIIEIRKNSVIVGQEGSEDTEDTEIFLTPSK